MNFYGAIVKNSTNDFILFLLITFMASNNNIELDFEGEFPPIKPLSLKELENDRLVKRIRLQRKLEKLEDHEISSSNNELISEIEEQPIAIDNPIITYSKNKIPKATSTNGQAENTSEINTSNIMDTHNQTQNSEPTESLVQAIDSSDHSTKKKETHNSQGRSKIKKQKVVPEKFKNFKLVDSGFDLLIKQRKLKEKAQKQLEDDLILQEKIKEAQPYDLPGEYKDFIPNENDVNLVRKEVLAQLVNKAKIFPNLAESPTLNSKYNEVYKMFEHTIRDHEGHSLLIIGPRSSGKTAIIQHALDDLSTKYPGQFITVRLNAYLHGDDIVALREVARQLDYNARKLRTSNEISLGNFEQRSISDTFTNILSTLDKNISGNNTNEHEDESVSIIFIVEEFENFTSGNKQTLLYNLFDLSQNSSTPICVVGVSTKVTARELLEKRVRSRFSQRIISINKATTIDEFWSNAKLGLTLNQKFIGSLSDLNYGSLWNKYVELMYHSNSSQLKRVVLQNYFTTKDFKDFNNNCIFAVSKVSYCQPFPNDGDFKQYLANQSINNIQSVVSSLSVLELLLVIAAARWIEKFDLQVVNFNLAYKEYEDMIKSFNTTSTTVNSSSLVDSSVLSNITINQKIWSPKILKNCWESLYKLGLLLDYGAVTTSADGQVISTASSNRNIIIEDNKMVQLDVTLDELHHLVDDNNVYRSLAKL